MRPRCPKRVLIPSNVFFWFQVVSRRLVFQWGRGSLFDSEQEANEERGAPNGHRRITDFTLYTDGSNVDQHEKLLANWKQHLR